MSSFTDRLLFQRGKLAVMLIHHQGGDVGIALYHLTEIRILKIGNLHAGIDVVVCRIVYEADKGDGVVEALEGLIER